MPIEEKRAVTLISGGLDSVVSSAMARSEGFKVYGLFFDYGQKNIGHERFCVQKVADTLHLAELREIPLPYLKDFGGSALFDPNSPLDSSNFLAEYVPFRNSQFLSVATAWAEVLQARRIYVGSTGGDRVCPDNSREYLTAFQEVIKQGTLINRDIELTAPLIDTDKVGAVEIGVKLGVPFEYTWSCHNEKQLACGQCSNCSERLKAFKTVGLVDPLPYESYQGLEDAH